RTHAARSVHLFRHNCRSESQWRTHNRRHIRHHHGRRLRRGHCGSVRQHQCHHLHCEFGYPDHRHLAVGIRRRGRRARHHCRQQHIAHCPRRPVHLCCRTRRLQRHSVRRSSARWHHGHHHGL